MSCRRRGWSRRPSGDGRERRHPRQVVTNPPPAPTQAEVVARQTQVFDAARQTILAPTGATSYQVSHQTIEAMPQGNNSTLDKVLLQFPGVTQDSAASGELHVRNEHANIQYRIKRHHASPMGSAPSGRSSTPASLATLRY